MKLKGTNAMTANMANGLCIGKILQVTLRLEPARTRDEAAYKFYFAPMSSKLKIVGSQAMKLLTANSCAC